tara:strand:+ start:10139 stop:10396 length:258 start_codon:yes stop_codon:yes gene_type:complete
MFRTGRLQQQELWLPFVVASLAMGLALYYTHKSPSSHVDEQPCQATNPDHKLIAMDPEERAYHERFMREAIAMVSLSLPTLTESG